MESSSTANLATVGTSPNPLLSLSTFMHRIGSQFVSRLEDTKRFAAAALPQAFPPPPVSLPFASVSQRQGKQNLATNLNHVARRLSGTSVYTVSNTNNEFVLISDAEGVKSIGLLCFRREDAEAFLAQVRSRKGALRGGAKVVPITLDQVYSLKVEGIAFRFLPDPVQIKNAMELKAGDTKSGFDGVPVFQDEEMVKEKQSGGYEPRMWMDLFEIKESNILSGLSHRKSKTSDLLVVKKNDRRYCPIYFHKEDLEKALSTVSRVSRGPAVSQHIMVGSLEDVLKKMEINEKNASWEDLIFIPPGKSHSQHIQEQTKV